MEMPNWWYVMRRVVRDIRFWFRDWRFRRKHGFSPPEWWNLGGHLETWIWPRLLYLAEHSTGAPYGYPMDTDEITAAEPEFNGSLRTDFDQWYADMKKAALALKAHATYDGDDYPEELRLAKEATVAMQWIAKWHHGMWD